MTVYTKPRSLWLLGATGALLACAAPDERAGTSDALRAPDAGEEERLGRDEPEDESRGEVGEAEDDEGDVPRDDADQDRRTRATDERADAQGREVSDGGPDAQPTPAREPSREACKRRAPSVDWSGAKELAERSGSGPNRLFVLDDASSSALHVCVAGSDLDVTAEVAEIVFDVDGHPGTGISEGLPWSLNGADHKLAGDFAYEVGPDGKWAPRIPNAAKLVRFPEAIVATVPRSQLRGLEPYFSVGFRLLDTANGWNPKGGLPSSGRLARYERPARTEHGLIVPMYALPAGVELRYENEPECQPGSPVTSRRTVDRGYEEAGRGAPVEQIDAAATAWGTVAKQAAELKRVDPTADYWVVVNGPRHRPFELDENFERARKSYLPIQRSGGKLFGYVHSLVDEVCNPTEYRKVDAVVADVARWVDQVPDLEGIWIDEFYPRLEYAAPDVNVFHFENGSSNVPLALRGLEGTTFNGGEKIDPAGGYYAQLTTAIRQAFPHLKLIGNAGGALESNQLLYANLVDVLVSFENSYAEALENGSARLKNGDDIPNRPQLALVHTLDEGAACSSDPEALMNEACPNLRRAYELTQRSGYRYFYATNGRVKHEGEEPQTAAQADDAADEDDPEHPTVWIELPPYFAQEPRLFSR